ncbi:sure-like protein [Daldinia decipiens]|uniref:sure-like protein n=1 Tax=Daldinia decipiens TaxID=326647 RepID=UPI0020C371E0|nr:sure-like protein [Daldinia decipiens]KAI1655838.1 sure-like protein [Daldinia decipiens]
MRVQLLSSVLLAVGAHGIRILQSNDDGWAEQYIRVLHDELNNAGHDVILSAPAENKSGTGSSDSEPSPRTQACEYNSCPAGSGAVGNNATNPRLNWVNSFPVTSARFGVETFAPQLWNGQAPELVVSGPNVGSNLFLEVPFSGTVGIATYATRDVGIPAIAFSGDSSGRLAFDAPVETRSIVYAKLATQFTNAVIAAGTPYLPDDVFLNVNFPKAEGDCTDPAKFKWVLSRINPGVFSERDVETCGTDRLPTESSVVGAGGCQISVSVGDSTDKTTAPADKQAIVLQKLGSLLSCLE